jgi:tRNA dimethylallyltransferase
LAKRYNGEIINGDAMQMYDGLPIITNKITIEEQEGIPHHLLGFIALDGEAWRVGMFKRKASQIIQEIRSRGRLPIVVGGTHYYTQSLIFDDTLVAEDGDGDEQATELSDRDILRTWPILGGPTEEMIKRLREVDPVMADRWHPNDRRRIRNSLEVYLMHGKKASEFYAEQKDLKLSKNLDDQSCHPVSETLLFWVHADREILKKRLDSRVDKMLEGGLIEELKTMKAYIHGQRALGTNVDCSRGIWDAIGWKQFEPYLIALETKSESSKLLHEHYSSSIEQTKAATRRYATRQTRWIRLKLLPALSEQNALSQLYLLDGSDITLWNDTVSEVAIGITEKFIAGSETPAPTGLSVAAKENLVLEKPHDSEATSTRQECNTCHVVCIGEDQWQTHLKSRRHRALLKKKQRMERNPNGRSSLPKDDTKSDSKTP